MGLQEFLKSKPLYYDKIDLSRMPRAYDEVKDRLKLGRVIHLVGTNGKGSTGRMLAKMLTSRGRVGHYTSPHILRFNERIWIDGSDALDEFLEEAHKKLQKWLRPETSRSLSYFEYTTLLALVAFEGLEYVVLEAGLGGEYDATAVVPKVLSVATPIGLDHQAFLGHTIESIAATKLRSVTNGLILAPQPYEESLRVAETLAAERGWPLYRVPDALRKRTRHEAKKVATAAGWPPFLLQNLLTAATAYEVLHDEAAPVQKAVSFDLPGRFQKIAPNVILDVGHNPLGAQVVADALADQKRVVVYNALSDKDVETVLNILKPIVKRVEIIKIEGSRAMESNDLEAILRKLQIPFCAFDEVRKSENYLVFGSFWVAEAFLRRMGRA